MYVGVFFNPRVKHVKCHSYRAADIWGSSIVITGQSEDNGWKVIAARADESFHLDFVKMESSLNNLLEFPTGVQLCC